VTSGLFCFIIKLAVMLRTKFGIKLKINGDPAKSSPATAGPRQGRWRNGLYNVKNYVRCRLRLKKVKK
jgi:hypothetical protein